MNNIWKIAYLYKSFSRNIIATRHCKDGCTCSILNSYLWWHARKCLVFMKFASSRLRYSLVFHSICYRNQSIDLQGKPVDCFLYDISKNTLRYESKGMANPKYVKETF